MSIILSEADRNDHLFEMCFVKTRPGVDTPTLQNCLLPQEAYQTGGEVKNSRSIYF